MTAEKSKNVEITETTGRETLAILGLHLRGGAADVRDLPGLRDLDGPAPEPVQGLGERRKILEQARQPIPADMVAWAEK